MRTFGFGGGVQSNAVMVLAARGEVQYDAFLFANVGDDSEDPLTLEYIDRYSKPFAQRYGIPLIELRRRMKRSGVIDTVYGKIHRTKGTIIPVRGENGAPQNRICTQDFKVAVCSDWTYANGARPDNPAVVGLGFSLDEHHRATTAHRAAWETPEYPLIERRIDRQQCLNIVREAGLPEPPKSACWFCPFRSAAGWRRMSRQRPELFQRAVDLEVFIRDRNRELGLRDVHFHKTLRPLSEVVEDGQIEMFGDDDTEWDGACTAASCGTCPPAAGAPPDPPARAPLPNGCIRNGASWMTTSATSTWAAGHGLAGSGTAHRCWCWWSWRVCWSRGWCGEGGGEQAAHPVQVRKTERGGGRNLPRVLSVQRSPDSPADQDAQTGSGSAASVLADLGALPEAGGVTLLGRLELRDFPRPDVARCLSPNGRLHHMARYRTTRDVAYRVKLEAVTQGLRPMRGLVSLKLTYVLPLHRHRDTDNYSGGGVTKAVIDSLVRGGYLEADDTDHLRLLPVEIRVTKGVRMLELIFETCSATNGVTPAGRPPSAAIQTADRPVPSRTRGRLR